MKRITSLLLFLSAVCGHAQVMDYTFSQTMGKYTEIQTGTKLGEESSDFQNFVDPNIPLGGPATVGPGFDIGFDFTFNNLVYNKFGVSNEGWIILGSSTVDLTVTNNLSALSSTADLANLAIISAMGNDLSGQPGSSLLFKTIGTAPNRTLVIQWKKYRKRSVGDGDSFDFQIRLNESTNAVEIVYGSFISNTAAGIPAKVGLRGAPATTVTNFVTRKSSNGWTNSTAGTDPANDKIVMGNTLTPPSGLTFTYTPPTCGSAKDLSITNITGESAVLSWDSYTPTPSSYEYVVSAASALPTGSGIPTTAKTANITGLNIGTQYYVFTRSKCTDFSPWKQVGAFKTACTAVSAIFEDFDSYDAAYVSLPFCWSGKTNPDVTTNASVKMTSSSVVPASVPNRLEMKGNADPAKLATSYAILPAVKFAEVNGTKKEYTLKFKAYATAAQKTLEVGYYANGVDINSFTPIETINLNSGAASAIEYTVKLPEAASEKSLGFKNAGNNAAATTAYIDDVKCEEASTCTDVRTLSYSELTYNSARISWDANTTTAWQYAYAPYSVTNPYTLTGTDVPGTNPTVQIDNLSSGTLYKVWIRSVCGSTLGEWIGPTLVQTACAPISDFAQNFDLQPSGTSNPLPTCWRKVGTIGAVSISQTSPYAPSAPNAFKIDGQGTGPVVVALPPVSTAQDGSHQLKFKVRASTPIKVNNVSQPIQFEIGYMTDVSDVTTFQKIVSITPGTAYSTETRNLGTYPQSVYLAFRIPDVIVQDEFGNPVHVTGSVFIDDVIWEPIPTCPDAVNLSTLLVNTDSAKLRWDVGDPETHLQYVVGTPTDMNPFILPASDVANQVNTGLGYMTGKINGLLTNAVNKVWIRTKCAGNSYGAWSEPLNFVTSCNAGTQFTQNFDTSTTMPSCWAVVGTGTVLISAPTGTTAPSAPNVMSLQAGSVPVVVAMPAMSNTTAATHRLTFKYRTTSTSATKELEVGYLLNMGDPASFRPLRSFACTNAFQPASVELGSDPQTQILAFRNNGTGVTMQIDDVVWEPKPPCPNISDLAITAIADDKLTFSWTKASTETVWQYAVGSMSDTNPEELGNYEVLDNPVAQATGLSPNTKYKIWVRSKCNDAPVGGWGTPIIVTTACIPVPNFTETFESSSLPDCWYKVSKGSVSVVSISTSLSEPNDGNKLFMYSPGFYDESVVAMPPLSNAGSVDHILRFRFKGTVAGAKLELGYIDNILDQTTFTPINTYTASSKDVSDVVTLNLGPSPVSNTLAFRVPGQKDAAILIDDVTWDLASALRPACVDNPIATPNTSCGNFATTISWDAVPGADEYHIDIRALGESYIVSDLNVGKALSYSFIGTEGTTYYYTISPANYAGKATGCVEHSFVTNANKCYCTSVPVNMDDKGITHIQLVTTEFENPIVTYNDFTAKTVKVAAGASNNLRLTFSTLNVSYNTYAWIDFNDDYVFDDSEKVFSGTSGYTPGNILNASFSISADAQLGIHRMRIVAGSVSSGYNGDPCYNGTHGVSLDFKVNVMTPVENDILLKALPLTVGIDFAEHAQTGTNVDATGSVEESAPACGNYKGDDVWYKAIVPASGDITFEVNSISGGLTDTAAAAYFFEHNDILETDILTLIDCDDSSSTFGDDQPKIALKGRTSGEVVYLRVWDKGGDENGAFKVSAYDLPVPVLGMDTFETNNFSFYPNPVRDILNLDLNKEITSVAVINLLGQQVINQSVKANQTKIDMSDLPNGAYLVKVTSTNQSKTIKVVKQ